MTNISSHPNKVFDVLTDAFQSTVHISELAGRSYGHTTAKLAFLLDTGKIERCIVSPPRGGHQCLWRKLPEGSIAPLYDAQLGVDARALAECFGGYTYLKTKEA
jgi:hypothetical protein